VGHVGPGGWARGRLAGAGLGQGAPWVGRLVGPWDLGDGPPDLSP
jgi:hypothetical protein